MPRPNLTLIASRTEGDRPYESTHRTKSTWRDALGEWGESLGKVIFGALFFVASFYVFAVFMLSLGGHR